MRFDEYLHWSSVISVLFALIRFALSPFIFVPSSTFFLFPGAISDYGTFYPKFHVIFLSDELCNNNLRRMAGSYGQQIRSENKRMAINEFTFSHHCDQFNIRILCEGLSRLFLYFLTCIDQLKNDNESNAYQSLANRNGKRCIHFRILCGNFPNYFGFLRTKRKISTSLCGAYEKQAELLRPYCRMQMQ